MAIFVDNVLDVYTINAIIDVLNDKNVFEDGKKTAGRTAKQVKNNLQAKVDVPAIAGVKKMVENALLENSLFMDAAQPYKFAKVMFNRYEIGMTYGAHVDDPFIAGTRTDLSFTLFLSDPESYEGGELVIKRNDGDEAVKLPKGSLYLYPSTSLHYVAPVTSGERIAVVGWVQSRVRSEEHREILFDLASTLRNLPDSDDNKESRLLLLKTKSNLTRLWSD